MSFITQQDNNVQSFHSSKEMELSKKIDILGRHLENLDNRLNQDISSIFSLLRDNTYQYSSLPSSNAHLLGNQDATQPSQHALAHSELADESVFLLPQSSDQKEENVSPENRFSIKEINISKPSPKPLPPKPRSSSAVNISCQTPQSIQSKRALSTSGGTRDLIPGSQEFNKRLPGSLLTDPMKPSYLSSAKGVEEQQKSSSEAPIARLESLEEAGMEAASRDAKAPSIHKQRSSDV